jgi:hypothetical protein
MGELIKLNRLKIVILLLLLASIFFVIFVPLLKTKLILNMAADSFSKNNTEDIGLNGESIVLFKDGWGNPIAYKRRYEKEKIIYCLISRGRDGILETNDDMVVERTKKKQEGAKNGHAD